MKSARATGVVTVSALLLFSFFSLGCATLFPSNDRSEKAPPGTASEDYVIGVPDLLSVRVWKHPDLSVDAPVRRDGKISIPLLNDVQAAGKTPESLAKLIKKRLAAFVSRPNVTVVVLSPDSQTVTVIGAVTASGAVRLIGEMGVLEAVAAAGGFTPWANKSDITVIRSVDGERISYGFDYRAYVAAEPDSDIALRPGDVVVVPE
jgi:polysaccharide export outer membrane protein